MNRLGILLLAGMLYTAGACTKEVEVEKIVYREDNAKVLQLEQQINTLNNTIDGLNTRVAGLLTDNTDLAMQLEEANLTITDLQSDITKKDLDIDALTREINGLTTMVDELTRQINAVNNADVATEDANSPANDCNNNWPLVDGVNWIHIAENVYYNPIIQTTDARVNGYRDGINRALTLAPAKVVDAMRATITVISPEYTNAQAWYEPPVPGISCYNGRGITSNDFALRDGGNRQQVEALAVGTLLHEYTHIAHFEFLGTDVDNELQEIYETALEMYPNVNGYWKTNRFEMLAEVILSRNPLGVQHPFLKELPNNVPGFAQWIETNLN